MKGKEMIKKIVLGVIIGMVVLTVSAGGIYAYQNNSDKKQGEVFSATNKNGNAYRNNSVSIQDLSHNGNGICDPEECEEQACLQIQNRNYGSNTGQANCENNYLNQNRNLKNNCNQYNNENCFQNQYNFCYQNTNQNHYNSQNCQADGQNSGQGKAIKNNYGKNK